MDKGTIIRNGVICVIMLYLAGCAENKYIKTEDRICLSANTKAKVIAAAEQILMDMHFEIEKLDLQAGHIRTYPLTGAQTFEFWRSDNVGGFNSAEADLHSIRRMVELNINQEAGRLCINCKAFTQRLSIAGELTSGSGDKAMSGQISLQKLGSRQKSNMSWIDLGRDGQLETEILKRIDKRLSADQKRLSAKKSAENE